MGGRVSDLAFRPRDPKTLYVAYATGGLWRSKNRGTTFQPVFEKEATSCIGSIAVARGKKEDGSQDTVWVGTGEGNGRNSSSWGNGVYRSTDGCKTWEHCGLAETHDIPRIAVDPRNADVCYAAALGQLWSRNPERGLYKTEDGGKTWSLALRIDDRTGCCEVVLDPANPDVVYAAMYDRVRTAWSFSSGGPQGGIYRSKDGGKTWKKLTKGLPKQTGRIGLDVFAKDTSRLIAVVEATEGGANSIRDDRMRGGGVFRSDDGGETWRRLSVRSPRAFYFSKVKFDPKDDKRVYMLGWTTEVSDDGGLTFREGSANLLHADHHAILVDPADPDHLVIGTDGGVYQSDDRGETWDFLDTMATGQFYNLCLEEADDYRVIGGLQDNGTWLGPSRTGYLSPKLEECSLPETSMTNAEWTNVFWGDGFHCCFDPTDPETVYAEWQGGHVTRLHLRTGEKRLIEPEAREGEPRHRFNWNTPFFVSPHDPSVLYQGGNFVFKLTERGDKWERISDDLTTCDPRKIETVGSNAETHCTVVSLAESPIKAGLLWAGSDDGLIHVTRNGGKDWTNVTPKAVEGRYVSRLHPSAHFEGRCYASIDGHRSGDMRPCVLATDDWGATWKEATGDLPGGRTVHVVREDLANPNVLYAGTEAAIFGSLDCGKTWIKLHGKRLPTVPIYDIQQHRLTGDLVVGTHGRSIWILDRARWIGSLEPSVASSALHLFPVAAARPRWFRTYPGQWTHKTFRASNPPMGVYFDYWVSEYLGEDAEVLVETLDGVRVKKLSGGGAPGFNRVVWNLEPEEWLKLADEGEEAWLPFQARPGKYRVSLKLGKHEAKAEFEVLPRLS